jgi:hypothetical protein
MATLSPLVKLLPTCFSQSFHLLHAKQQDKTLHRPPPPAKAQRDVDLAELQIKSAKRAAKPKQKAKKKVIKAGKKKGKNKATK